MTAVKGFVAGVLSVVTFMSAAWWLARNLGYIPANAPPLWALQPSVPPLGVPRVANLAFWGGVWGLVLALLFRGLSNAVYWLAWLLAGAIAVGGTAVFIVPTIKGTPINVVPMRLIVSAILNGAFGLGTAIWLMILGRART